MELVDQTTSALFSNKYSSNLITLFLVLYGGLAAPKLPQFMVNLFENPIFKIIILSLIVYKGNNDPMFAIMVAVVFTVTLDIIKKQKFLETFTFDCSDGWEYNPESHKCVCNNKIDTNNNCCAEGDICHNGLCADENGNCNTEGFTSVTYDCNNNGETTGWELMDEDDEFRCVCGGEVDRNGNCCDKIDMCDGEICPDKEGNCPDENEE